MQVQTRTAQNYIKSCAKSFAELNIQVSLTNLEPKTPIKVIANVHIFPVSGGVLLCMKEKK